MPNYDQQIKVLQAQIIAQQRQLNALQAEVDAIDWATENPIFDSVKLMLETPAEGQPPAGDPWKPNMMWDGGEQKFGKWRMYFNWAEKGWMLTYNCPYDRSTNSFGPRDSGDWRSSSCMYMAFNFSEGNWGANGFGINFAPPGPAGTPPYFPAGASYGFAEGLCWASANQDPNKLHTPRPASFIVRGQGGMGSEIVHVANDDTDARTRLSVGLTEKNIFEIRPIVSGANNQYVYGEPLFSLDPATGIVTAKKFTEIP